jgi:hypothetical protein
MIGLCLMTSQSQEIDLNIRRPKNVSIAEKKGHIRMNYGHWRKEQTEDKDQKHDDENDTIAVVDD